MSCQFFVQKWLKQALNLKNEQNTKKDMIKLSLVLTILVGPKMVVVTPVVVFEILSKQQKQRFWDHAENTYFTKRGPGGRPGTPEPGPKIVVFRMVPKCLFLLFGSYFKNNHV